MFKSLVWKQEKENRYKAIVDLSSGAFRNHISYRVFLHKGEYWRVMVSGNFVGIVELEKSETKEEAIEKANKDCQNHLIAIQDALNKMKV